MTAIHVQIKNVYGNELVYPACESARYFAKIAGTSTLTPHTIYCVKSLGYKVIVQPQQPAEL